MPYASIARKREYDRQWQRNNAAYAASLFPVDVPSTEPLEPFPDDPVGAFVDWAETVLRVPSGPLSSKPFRVPDWQRQFLEAAHEPGVLEAGLSVARKNGKSGIIAAYLLACLVGPLVRRDWRCVVVSLTGALAKELKDAMEATALASNITDVTWYASPPPGRAIGKHGSRVVFLAADRATGHAIGSDLVVIDEAGLLPEASRPLWNAVLSSTSGRNGRLMAISIRGDGPMFGEIADRKDDPEVRWIEYAAKEDAAYDDVQAWIDANPGLRDGIKSLDYMRRMSRRAISNPNNGPHFAAYDLNLPQEPTRELILTLSQWKDAVVEDAPVREGPCFVGLDLGGSASMTASVAYWPVSGRIEVFGAFPALPDLAARGEGDGVGGLYQRMYKEGELVTYPGRVTPVALFIDHVETALYGERVMAIGCDRYRRDEMLQAMSQAGIAWPIVFRGQGASTNADGSADVRAFQEEILTRAAKPCRSLMLEAAIANSSIARDAAGNPKLDKAKAKGRIDALQAGVIALGLGRRWRRRNSRSRGTYKGMA